ncbi:MAG: hypothetical protein IID14_02195 [Candidatus Marinimicrobia bacterium]|nr:hypothetical protein [Candidatus Neomarinimicrobiota bacterium]
MPTSSHKMNFPKLPSHLQLMVFFLIVGCTENTNQLSSDTVALVNGVPITKEELVFRLELTVLPEFQKLMGRNERVLDVLIDELVVSQWAEGEDLTASPVYQEAVDFVKQQALIRELFFEEIKYQAEPDSANIYQALQKSIQELSIQILFTENQDISERWRQSLLSGKTFNELVNESRDNPFIYVNNSMLKWGDGSVPISIEIIAYQLKLGESSDLLELNDVYLIFSINDKTREIILTEYDYSLKWQRVKKVLQARIESRLADEYVDSILTHLDITQRATGFLEVSRYIEDKLGVSSEHSIPLPSGTGQEFPPSLDYNLDLPVVETPDYTWTGKNVLSIIRKYNYRVNSNSPIGLRSTLTQFLKGAVRDQYLSERAKQLGLESKTRVKQDVQMWSRYFLYMQGVTAFVERDTSLTNSALIAARIKELRRNAQITINYNLLETIELTGIPMLAFWSGGITRQLAVPPLMEFR